MWNGQVSAMGTSTQAEASASSSAQAELQAAAIAGEVEIAYAAQLFAQCVEAVKEGGLVDRQPGDLRAVHLPGPSRQMCCDGLWTFRCYPIVRRAGILNSKVESILDDKMLEMVIPAGMMPRGH